ncbi:MAG: Hsp20/alpha crystallin family protein, partial [Pirellulales bacterium]
VHRTSMFPFSQLRQELDRAVSHWFGDMPNSAAPNWAESRVFPALNVWEHGDNLMVEAELPGIVADELEITVVGGELTLKGQRLNAAEEGTTFHRRERAVGNFTRMIKLPVEVDADKVQAAFKDGVLTITLPKSEASRPRKIQISAG